MDSLDKFIYNYNNSVHSVTKSKLINAIKSGEKRQSVIKDNIVNKTVKVSDHKFTQLNIGDHVRISNLTKKEHRKLKFRKEYMQNWSKSYYKINKIIKPKIGEEQYQLLNISNKIKSRLYFRYELQKIDINTLQVIHKEKPIYSEQFFNRETHTKLLNTKPRQINNTQPNNIKQSLRKTNVTVNVEPEYEVEKIVKEGLDKNNRKLYLVKWVGWPESSNTWEPYNNIKLTKAYELFLKNKKQL